MSKTKGKSYLRKVGDTGSTAEIREALRKYLVGQTADIWDRLILQRQYNSSLQDACAPLDKGDLEGFFKAVGKALLLVGRLQMKMKKFVEQTLPPREAYEQDKERILTILEEVVPGSRDKIIQGIKKGENRSKHTRKEKSEEKKGWYEAFVGYVVEEWKKKGTITDEESTREKIDAMMFLLSDYRLKCLMATLVELDDMVDDFDEKYPEYQEEGR